MAADTKQITTHKFESDCKMNPVSTGDENTELYRLCAIGERGTVVIVSYLHSCSICSTSYVGNIIQSVGKE